MMDIEKRPAYTVTVVNNDTVEIDTYAGDIVLAASAISNERRSHSTVRVATDTSIESIMETLSWLVARTLISVIDASGEKLDSEYLLLRLVDSVSKKIAKEGHPC